MSIRKAETSDASRIAEMIVTNYRANFYPIFQNEDFYFGELNVLDVAKEYMEEPDVIDNTYVYDDGVVKGMIRLDKNEIVKLYVEPQFQNQRIGAKLLTYAMNEKAADWLWVLEKNTRGIAFYKRNGFDMSGEKMLEDGWIPLLKMECKR
ncbi:putative acetyltransferase [Lachnospiraceae bacterium]|nr:putative acetyltransferase [Lachnospiraceae bacterium]